MLTCFDYARFCYSAQIGCSLYSVGSNRYFSLLSRIFPQFCVALATSVGYVVFPSFKPLLVTFRRQLDSIYAHIIKKKTA